jgi:phospholipid N-methyltransferase
MKWMTKNRMVCSIIGGAIAVTLLSTSVVTLADHIHKESTQTIGDTIEVTNMLNQTVPEKVLTEGNITVDMIDQQLENTSVVELESKEEVAQYLEIDEDNVITGEANVVKEVDNSASKSIFDTVFCKSSLL